MGHIRFFVIFFFIFSSNSLVLRIGKIAMHCLAIFNINDIFIGMELAEVHTKFPYSYSKQKDHTKSLDFMAMPIHYASNTLLQQKYYCCERGND